MRPFVASFQNVNRSLLPECARSSQLAKKDSTINSLMLRVYTIPLYDWDRALASADVCSFSARTSWYDGSFVEEERGERRGAGKEGGPGEGMMDEVHR